MRLKTVLLLTGVITAITCWSQTNQYRSTIKLGWDYPTNGVDWDLSFVLSSSSDVTLPLSNWAIIDSKLAAVLPAKTNGNTITYEWELTNSYARQFFTLRASNYHGLSPFSNVTNTPALPISDVNLRLR